MRLHPKNHPGKTIGVLYQNDDFLERLLIGLREAWAIRPTS
jgi:hypothetical protein